MTRCYEAWQRILSPFLRWTAHVISYKMFLCVRIGDNNVNSLQSLVGRLTWHFEATTEKHHNTTHFSVSVRRSQQFQTICLGAACALSTSVKVIEYQSGCSFYSISIFTES